MQSARYSDRRKENQTVSMTTIVNVGARSLLEACERRGIQRAELLAKAGIRNEEIENPEARILTSRAFQLSEEARRRVGDGTLGIDAARKLPFGAYRAIDYMAATS